MVARIVVVRLVPIEVETARLQLNKTISGLILKRKSRLRITRRNSEWHQAMCPRTAGRVERLERIREEGRIGRIAPRVSQIFPKKSVVSRRQLSQRRKLSPENELDYRGGRMGIAHIHCSDSIVRYLSRATGSLGGEMIVPSQPFVKAEERPAWGRHGPVLIDIMRCRRRPLDSLSSAPTSRSSPRRKQFVRPGRLGIGQPASSETISIS